MHATPSSHRSSRRRAAALTLSLALVFACASPPAPAPPAVAPEAGSGFEPERAMAHWAALHAMRDRSLGSAGADEARAYLRAELEALGLSLVEQRFPIERVKTGNERLLRNLVAEIPGASSDVFLLVTPYDTHASRDVRARPATDASGAAVMLELARVLSEKSFPYTVWLAFLEGEAPPEDETEKSRSDHGSRALARRLRFLEANADVRLVVATEHVCDAGLRIARDRQSHRNTRSAFWRAAQRVGHGETFPRTARYESPRASHRALLDAGFRNAVALVGSTAGDAASSVSDDCSPESLAAVGDVTLAALDRTGKRFAKIDRYADSGGAGGLALEQLQVLRAMRSSEWNGIVRVEDEGGTRRLITGPEEKRLLQSSMELAEPHRLVDNYTQISSILASLHADPRRVFNIGLGGGVLPRFHLHRYPESQVQSVEIDPVVITFAEQFFGVVDPRHAILEGDGAAALRRSEGGYDIIVVDAYSDTDGVPGVFRKQPFVDALPRKLADEGIVVANLWARDPSAFERLVSSYKRKFSRGVRVTIPEAKNHIVAVGGSSNLTCAAFEAALDAWIAEGSADVAWPEDDPTPRCRDL
ncbi:MAG: fused MFS/spermidine synthase [Myxococcota bacterium]